MRMQQVKFINMGAHQRAAYRYFCVKLTYNIIIAFFSVTAEVELPSRSARLFGEFSSLEECT